MVSLSWVAMNRLRIAWWLFSNLAHRIEMIAQLFKAVQDFESVSVSIDKRMSTLFDIHLALDKFIFSYSSSPSAYVLNTLKPHSEMGSR